MSFGFDPSIILRNIESDKTSFADILQTLSNLRTAQGHQQHQQAMLSDLARQRQEQEQLRGIYQSNAESPDSLPAALLRGGFGPQAFAAQDQTSQMRTAEAMRRKQAQEMEAAYRKHIGEVFYGVKDQAGLDVARKQLMESGDPFLSIYAQTKIPETYDAKALEPVRSQAMSAKERADLEQRGLDREEKEKDRTNRTTNARIIAGDKAEAASLAGTTGLRKEIDARPEIKKYRQSSAELASLKELAKESSGANDMALVFAFMKAMDPESVVRESEYASAEATGKPTERMMGFVSKYWTGGRLTQGQKQAFIRAAAAAQSGHKTNYDRALKTYKGVAKKRGYDAAELGLDDEAPSSGPLTDAERDELKDLKAELNL